MSLLHQFTHFFKQHDLLPPKAPLLLAVSGGIDSVVVCELCSQAGFPFAIAHCNFGLRGAESERDELFVSRLADKYGVEKFIHRFGTETFAEEQRVSIQEAARALRYQWFGQLRSEKGFSYTVVAHHADDNIETVLMNFFRGTGLQGLTAIPSVNLHEARILRPLLHVRRNRIEEFAHQHQLSWVEDSSNASVKYTRNYFRNDLIPKLRSIYPQVEENILDNIERFIKINEWYRQSVADWKKKTLVLQGNEIRIPVQKLLQQEFTSLPYELIRDFGFGEKQVEEVLKLATAPSGKYLENESHQIIRHGRWLIIAPKNAESETIAIDQDQTRAQFNGGALELKKTEISAFRLEPSEWIAQVDARELEFPLVLRKWKTGDYFYPLGMRKKKKLARFFIDQKLPKNQKQDAWVLESNKRIVWIPGMRIDDRFKITPNTQSFFEITFKR